MDFLLDETCGIGNAIRGAGAQQATWGAAGYIGWYVATGNGFEFYRPTVGRVPGLPLPRCANPDLPRWFPRRGPGFVTNRGGEQGRHHGAAPIAGGLE